MDILYTTLNFLAYMIFVISVICILRFEAEYEMLAITAIFFRLSAFLFLGWICMIGLIKTISDLATTIIGFFNYVTSLF
jgi:hypothetical protein